VALDREQILKAAVDLMDEVGLAGLSLRRLAKQLGVAAPALYWHFQNKQELLDQMAEQMFIGEVPAAGPPGDGESWEDWLVTRARQTRAALLRHRDAAMLAASTKPRGSQWDQIELQIRVLCEAGFTPVEATRAMFTMSNYVAGFALEEQADRVRDASGSGPDGDVHTPEEISAWVLQQGDYPLLAEALAAGGDPQGDAVFEYGLRLLIDGMRERLRRSA
jgi:TetR/AcrR family transcriptional regulator, tetracycline repressor protein